MVVPVVPIVIVSLTHLAGLAVLPGGARWLFATAFPAALLLAWRKPDDRPVTTQYSLGLIGVTSALCLVYRILYVLAAATPDPVGATLYSAALWALGLAGVTYLGYLVYVIRFLFWERLGSLYGARATSAEVVADLKRQRRDEPAEVPW